MDAVRQQAPDVLIADIGMTRMDGFQLIRAIRQLHEPARSTHQHLRLSWLA
jgi:CheY-like chemotaxis protein